MTKEEEAINYLSDTKVYVDGNSKEIQEKLFELGFVWNSRNRKVTNEDYPFLYISRNKTIMCENDMSLFKSHPYKEITANDILKIKVGEDTSLKPFDRVLVRDFDEDVWCANLFSHCELDDSNYPFRTLYACYKQCIPYKGNEHLIGTNKLPK